MSDSTAAPAAAPASAPITTAAPTVTPATPTVTPATPTVTPATLAQALTPQAAPTTGTPPAAVEVKPTDPVDVSSLPANVQHLITTLRTEAADRRTTAKAAEDKARGVLSSVAQALGLEPPATEDEAPTLTPEQVTAQVTAARDEARAARIALAVFQNPGDGDPSLLVDSRSFAESVANLDPHAADFAAELQTAIKAAVEANPKLRRTTQAVAPSTVDHTGRTGGTVSTTPQTLTDALSGHYGTAR